MLTVITSTVPSQSKCHLFTFQPPWSVSVLVSYHLYWNDWLLIPQFLLSAAKFSVFFLFPLFLGQILSQVSSCIFLKIDEFLFLQDFKLQKCCKKLCLIFFVILFFFFFFSSRCVLALSDFIPLYASFSCALTTWVLYFCEKKDTSLLSLTWEKLAQKSKITDSMPLLISNIKYFLWLQYPKLLLFPAPIVT